jgi:hypothetical protein
MARLSGSLLAILLGAVVSSCGGNTAPSSPGRSPSGGSGSGGSGSAGGRETGETSGVGGTSTQNGGASPDAGTASPQGTGGTMSEHCPSENGQLAYGPIGDPYLLPIRIDSGEECATCGALRSLSGFRVDSGFGFVWDIGFDSAVPRWSLNSMIMDSNFGAGEPRTLLTRDAAVKLEVVPSRGGFVAATCSEGSTPEWILLNGDLEVPGGASSIVPEVPCGRSAPSVLWTGEAYFTSFVDARGLVLALLDEQGATVREEVLSEEIADPQKVRFSQKGDRVLLGLVRRSGGQARYGVLDLTGALIGDLQALGEAESFPSELAISTSGDGWLVATNYAVTNKSGVWLTQISRDGLISREQQWPGGYSSILALTPSAYGGLLYVGMDDTGGQYGATSWRIARIDSELETVYDEWRESRDSVARPFAVISDPHRDLIIQVTPPEGTISVQEYGCLN